MKKEKYITALGQTENGFSVEVDIPVCELSEEVAKEITKQSASIILAGFLNWAKSNSHDLGEFGIVVKLEYLENYVKDDFPYPRPYGVK